MSTRKPLRTAVALALLLLLPACGGRVPAEPVGTADPADVAARLIVRLDTATAELGLSPDARVVHTGFCGAATYEAAPKDRYVVVAGYRYTPGVSAQNDHIVALYEHWGALGWAAEIRFDGYTGLASGEASDAGDAFKALTDWREMSVSVTSPCYLFQGEPVWGAVTPGETP